MRTKLSQLGGGFLYSVEIMPEFRALRKRGFGSRGLGIFLNREGVVRANLDCGILMVPENNEKSAKAYK